MRHIMVLLSVILTMCTLTHGVYAQGPTIPPEVEEVAQQGLEVFGGMVGPKATVFGFTDSQQVSEATLGPGRQIYRVNWEKVRGASGENLLDLVFPVQEWRYTIHVGGVPKGYIRVAPQAGRYEVVEGGGLKEDFGVALDNWRRLVSDKGAAVEPILIETGVDYYFAGKIGAEEFVMTTESPDGAQAGFAGGMDYTRLRPACDLVQYLQKVQREGEALPPGSRGGGGSPDMGATGSADVGRGAASSSPALPMWAGALLLLACGALVAGALAWQRRSSSRRRA